jgi:hypothetical protein
LALPLCLHWVALMVHWTWEQLRCSWLEWLVEVFIWSPVGGWCHLNPVQLVNSKFGFWL